MSNLMTIEEFLIENAPDILAQYRGYVSKTLPEIGTNVKSLGWGFGGAPGTVLKVKGYVYKNQKSTENATWGDDYIILSIFDDEYLADMDEWWKQIVPVK
ncbi:hypothetical protein NST33_18275 [Paenibacillus sp. FSL L8-0435]|uniref:hypothetical protein n=1 Tax=Paenibacillus sp. FSL L8-0435 TaxID=2954618 RepID=UPI0030DA1AB6